MSALRAFHRPRLWLGLWAVGWALAIVLSLAPVLWLPPMPDLPEGDKLGHLLAYATLAGWAMGLFARPRAQAWALLALFALGGALELAQAGFTEGRQGDLRDLLANSLGLALGVALGRTRLGLALQWLDRRLPGAAR